VLEYAITRADLGGRDITLYLQRILTEANYYLSTTSEREMVRDLKETLCYVSLDIEAELKKMKSSLATAKETKRSYELPDAHLIHIDSERFRAPEAIFHPSFLGHEMCGVHELAFNSAIRCGIDLEKQMFSNVILSGGNTLFPGFVNRFRKEVMILQSSIDRPVLNIIEKLMRR
jgi:actin-related protein